MSKWIITILLMVGSCIANSETKNEIVHITVWVHGTHRTFLKLGKIPLVSPYVNHEEGLYRSEECLEQYVYRKIAVTVSQAAPAQFPAEHFYVFCWSGVLSHEARLEAAQALNNALNDLVLKYEKKCVITLITHSHGGNVALNLASFSSTHEYFIDSLILLAVPVQQVTLKNVEHPLFKNIFSIYSRWDLMQAGDPQGFGQSRKIIRKCFTRGGQEVGDLEETIPFFSQRTFPQGKVKHIEVRHATLFGNRPIGHIEFLLPHFTRHIDSIIKKAMSYDFSDDAPMIFNLERASIFDGLFR